MLDSGFLVNTQEFLDPLLEYMRNEPSAASSAHCSEVPMIRWMGILVLPRTFVETFLSQTKERSGRNPTRDFRDWNSFGSGGIRFTMEYIVGSANNLDFVGQCSSVCFICRPVL